MFGLINKARSFGNKYNGNTDFLEALCAAAVLVAYADGNADDAEVLSALDVIKAHKAVAGNFTGPVIDKTFETMFAAGKTLPGRLRLKREINDVANRGNTELNEDVFAVAVEVSAADGDIGAKEAAVLADLASRLGVKASDFGL